MSLTNIAPNRRKLTPKVKHWNITPGQPVPLPTIEDDRSEFKVDVVKDVLAWLESIKPGVKKPTPITINLSRVPAGNFQQVLKRFGKAYQALFGPTGEIISGQADDLIKSQIDYGSAAEIIVQGIRFRAQTVEMPLEDAGLKRITFTFHYLAARDDQNRIIVGPFLKRGLQSALPMVG